ncbi:uncharacterized protein LOC115388566 [Salarias fasciatus]|uniref:Uncharacterized LOC115388566 n=1 Tax=Salarias fasciatus TaxID=181472 RepID=A0A672HYF0_SALFA|nr:uncharacterized protein LOC115388566 [Salarias fasciatus]
MDGSRKRSVVWEFFKSTESGSVQCQLCRTYMLKQVRGSTTNMLKHVRTKHPAAVSQRIDSMTDGDFQDLDPDREQFCSVEVSLDDGDSDTVHSLSETASNGVLQSLAGDSSGIIQRVVVTNCSPTGRKRSLIWNYFERLTEAGAACCHICSKQLQFSENSSTSNLRRHILKRHPKVFSELTASMQQPPRVKTPRDPIISMDTEESFNTTEQIQPSVKASQDDGDSDAAHSPNETSSNGMLHTSQESSETVELVVETNCSSASRMRHKPSLIWNYFERLASLSAARCRICMKKLQCGKNSGTSNLRRHMLKRHPKVFSELKDNGQAFSTNIDDEGTSGTTEPSGARRVLRREQELIEALRRTQKEEARTLEHQRELLHKLRTAHAREVAAEKEGIELLRKTQQKEAEDLRRQREELKKEKEDLLRKWEEFREASKTILLFSDGQQAT